MSKLKYVSAIVRMVFSIVALHKQMLRTKVQIF